MGKSFFDEIGGMNCIKPVHKVLYDKLLSHSWLKKFFVGFERWHLEVQQTDFMADLFGRRPKFFSGRLPMYGHQHIFITEEVFMIRHNLLADSISESGLSDDHKERWLKFDMDMKPAIVKIDPDECEGRYRMENIIIVPKP